MGSFVSEHNNLYLLLSKSILKHKFYIIIIVIFFKKNGPIILIFSIRFEGTQNYKDIDKCHPLLNRSWLYYFIIVTVANDRLLLNTKFSDQNLKLGFRKCISQLYNFLMN